MADCETRRHSPSVQSRRRRSLTTVLAAMTLLCCAGPLSASGVLLPTDGSAPIRIRSHRVTAELEDGLARTTMRQTFVNPHSRTLEAVYVFPLPDGASLTGLAMEVAGQRLEGFLAERRTARRAYDTLVRREIDPALVEQIGRSTFRLSVYPVVPDQPTVIELTWIASVPLIQGEYRYVYPLAQAGVVSTTEQDLTAQVTVRSSAPIVSVESPNEGMVTRKLSDHEARGSFERSEAALSEDLVVVTRVSTPRPTMAVHVYRPPGQDPYFAAVVTPPELAEHQIVPRDVTLVLDMSGSMNGTKFDQAQQAALWLLDHLRPTDRVNLLTFNDVVRRFAQAPVSATSENLQRLREFVRQTEAGGSTALGDAIRLACQAPREAGRSAMAVFLTDGLPTVGEKSPERLVQIARESAGEGLRTHTFGVGKDVDGALLEGVAAAGGGTAELFRPAGEVATRLQTFLHRTASAAIVDLQVSIGGQPVADLLPRPLPNLYLGEQAVLCGRVPLGGEQMFALRGTIEGRPFEMRRSIDLDPPSETAGLGKPVARDLYARAKLDFLQRALRLRKGLSDEAYFAALDRGAYSTEGELVSALIDLSLETGVQCPYTSLLALLPEDRQRLNPRDADALDAALQRAQVRRREIARLAESPVNDRPSSSEHTQEPTTRSPIRPPVSTPQALDLPALPAHLAQLPAESWKLWWHYNREPFLDLKNRKDSNTATSGSGAFLIGRGKSRASGPSVPLSPSSNPDAWDSSDGLIVNALDPDAEPRPASPRRSSGRRPRVGIGLSRPTADDIEREIIPVLVPLLDSDPEVAASVCRSLGRMVRPDDAGTVFAAIVRKLGQPRGNVNRNAALSLGLLGTRDSVDLLDPIARDALAGRTWTAMQHGVPTQLRAIATLSLGLVGDPNSFSTFRGMIERATTPEFAELGAMAVVALGLTVEHDSAVPFLLETMRDPSFPAELRAQCPIAIGKLHLLGGGSPAALSALPELLSALTSGEESVDVRRSLVLAIGMLSEVDNQSAIDALQAVVREDADAASRHFALFALAQIGGRDPQPNQHREAHRLLEARLVSELQQPLHESHPPIAALALGVYAATNTNLADEVIRRCAELLLNEFGSSDNPSKKGAIATALGLLNFEAATDDLREAFETTNDDSLRGAIAVTLGMIRCTVGEELRELVVARDLGPGLRLQLARGLGLMGDAEAEPHLLDAFSSATDRSYGTELAQAVGLLGDRAGIEPLLDITQDASAPAWKRAAACDALGSIAEKSDLPWSWRVSVNSNYLLPTRTLRWIQQH